MRITVVGCGNGAFATAIDLASQGHEITLYVDRSHSRNFDAIRENRTIIGYGVGPVGPVTLHEVTCEESIAFRDTELIFIVVPSFAHEDVAERIAPYLRDGDRIVLSPGSTGGALVFAGILRERAAAKDIRIAEIHTLPYTVRKVGADGVRIRLMLQYLLFAVFPAKYSQEMFELVRSMYPAIVLTRDVLETSLNNGNATTHPAPVVLNAGKIEYYGKHYHYAEGITPSVGRVIQKIDDERKAICRAYGYAELDVKERLYRMGYCPLRETVYDCIQGSTEVFLPVEGPNTLNDRYLVEDAPFSLVAMIELAQAMGVQTPLMESVVCMASALMDEPYRETGRTLVRMGLDGMSPEEIRHYLETGERA